MKKKLVSLLLAAAMTMSVMSPFAGTAFAEEAAEQNVDVQVETVQATDESADVVQNSINDQSAGTSTGKEAEPEAVQQAGALFEALPAAGDVAAMTAEEKAAVSEQVAQALNAVDALSLADYDIFMASYGEMYDAVCNDLMAALMATAEDAPSDLSLRPMEETTGVYLPLLGYSKEQLHNFPVDNILGMLVDKNGNSIQVDSGYTNAWFYFTQEDIDETHALGTGEAVDLWNYNWTDSEYGLSGSYTMYMVLGNGNQMDDAANHRYIITVEVNTSTILNETISISATTPSGWSIYGSSRTKETDLFENLGMQGKAIEIYTTNARDDNMYTVGAPYSEIGTMQRMGYKVDVYPMSNFLNYRDNGAELTGAITDQFFADASYNRYYADYGTEPTMENYMTAPNLFCLVVTETATGRMLGYFGFSVTVRSLSQKIQVEVYTRANGYQEILGSGMISSTSVPLTVTVAPSATQDAVTTGRTTYQSWYTSAVEVPEGTIGQTCYLSMPKVDELKAVYDGRYNSLEEAQASGMEITGQIMADGTGTDEFGYAKTLSYINYLTLVFQDGQTQIISLYAYEQMEDTTPTYSQNEIDPDFEISDISLQGTRLQYYVAKAVGGIQLDTYYRNDEKYEVGGYQLVMIRNQLSADSLKQLIPEFNTPEGVVVSSGSRAESGKTDLSNAVWSDSMTNTVMYQVHVPGKKLKNYQVTFATLQNQGTLYVAGPDERFVNLTADNKFVHDILVTNIGATDLEGVKVELIDPVHVKLDEYWTVNNATIPAFNSVYNDYVVEDENGQTTSQNNDYATLANIAKIRLLADGEGEISGTLRVTTADGQVREIKLTGIAANPHIVSADLGEAVKYVPYSYMVVTDNMYNWNRSSFKIVDGALPAGMELYEATGEVYGVPVETGDFTFTVQVDYSSSRFSPSTATFTLHVTDNTNISVYEQTDEGYEIQVPLGVEQGEGTYDFLLTDITQDQLYVSEGVHPEFMGLWLNGEKLVRGVDYTSVSGSTRITIKSQTLQEKAYTDDYNTIAAEFRVDGDRENELKRTAQNFRLGEIKTSTSDDNQNGSSGGGSSDNSQDSTAADSAAEDAAAQAAAQAAALAAKGVNLRFYIVDEADEPMAGVKVELHSTPRTGVTDSNGCVAFSGVEFGKHTLTVYGEDGEVLASKSFELVSGAFGTNGDVITVMGGSTLSIRVKAANGVLSFVRVDLPQTGDESNMVLWVIVLAAAVCLFVGVNIYKKKRNDVTSDDQT